MKIDIFCQPSIVDNIFKMCPESICFSSSSSSSQITIFTCLDHCTSCIYLTATILSATVYSSLPQSRQVHQSMTNTLGQFTVQTVQLVTLMALPTPGLTKLLGRQRLPMVPMITVSFETWTPIEQELE